MAYSEMIRSSSCSASAAFYWTILRSTPRKSLICDLSSRYLLYSVWLHAAASPAATKSDSEYHYLSTSFHLSHALTPFSSTSHSTASSLSGACWMDSTVFAPIRSHSSADRGTQCSSCRSGYSTSIPSKSTASVPFRRWSNRACA